MHAARTVRLPWSTVLGYAAGNFASQILPIILLAWVMFFYSPADGTRAVLLSSAMVSTIRVVVYAAGAGLEPLVGWLSDRTRTRFGRRMPWIVLGAPFLCGSFIAIWNPPAGRPTDDLLVAAWFAACIAVFRFSYTVVVGPYLSLMPELAEDAEGRMRLSVWMSVAEVASNVAGSLAAGQLAAMGAVLFLGTAFDSGYQLMGVLFGGGALALYALVPVLVREPPAKPSHEVKLSILEAARASLDNPRFLPYALAVGGYRMATTAAIVGVPFVATQLMGVGEELAGLMLAIIILIALAAFPLVQRWANVHGPARVFRWGGIGFVVILPLIGTVGMLPAIPPWLFGSLLFVFSGFPVATVMVLPRAILAEVIDLDEKRTGYRREAMYNGMSGVVEQGGEVAAFGITGYLFALGNSAAQPLGLRLFGAAAALGVLGGLVAFRRYGRDA